MATIFLFAGMSFRRSVSSVKYHFMLSRLEAAHFLTLPMLFVGSVPRKTISDAPILSERRIMAPMLSGVSRLSARTMGRGRESYIDSGRYFSNSWFDFRYMINRIRRMKRIRRIRRRRIVFLGRCCVLRGVFRLKRELGRSGG